MRNQKFELLVHVNNKPVTEYRHDGDVYIEGRHRSEFEMVLINNSSTRKLFVPSVDGLSVVNGEPASSNSPGFILDGYEQAIVPGWMLDNTQAAKFYFSLSRKEESYAEQMGYSDQNNGVIGVRVFEEKPKPKPPKVYRGAKPSPFQDSGLMWRSIDGTACDPTLGFPEIHSASLSAESIDSALADPIHFADAKQLGTGFGEEIDFETTEVQFEKGSAIVDLVIYYDTIRGLAARGVDVMKKKARRSTMGASAFPGDYCKRPG